MKTIIAVRHSKSSHDVEFVADINRQLNRRGLAEAEMMGTILAKEKLKPGLLISSPALRAISTALIIAPLIKTGYETITINKDLYMQGALAILDVIQQQDDEHSTIMLTGHNPDFHNLVDMLVDNNVAAFPTTAIAIMDFKTNQWTDIRQGTGKLRKLLLPEQFRSVENDN